MVTELTPSQLRQILLNITPSVSSFDNTANKMFIRVDKQRACNGIAKTAMRYHHFSSSVGVGWDTPYFEQKNVSNVKVLWSQENITRHVNAASSYIVPRCLSHTSTATQSADVTYATATFSYPYPDEGTSSYIQDYIDTVIADPTKIGLNPPYEKYFTKYLRSTCTPRSYLNDFMQHRQPFGPSKLFKKTARSSL